VCWLLLAFPAGPVPFVFATLAGSLGTGHSPSLNSLALELADGAAVESGKIFGALSVVNSVCMDMLGPVLFGGLYALTVGTFPSAILIAPFGIMSIALVCSLLIRLQKDDGERESV